MEPQGKYIKSERGANLLVSHDYIHRKRKSVCETSYRTCVRANFKGKITHVTDHHHEPDTDKMISIEKWNRVKECAEHNNYSSLKQAYNLVTNQMFQSDGHSTGQYAASLKLMNNSKR